MSLDPSCPSSEQGLPNFVTFDVEDWASSSTMLLRADERERANQLAPSYDDQLERGVRAAFRLLEYHRAKATFFVVARNAKLHRTLIQELSRYGHEIASHSYSHAALRHARSRELTGELESSKRTLEDIIGCEVIGFRAPYLTPPSPRYDYVAALCAAGYRYDSSTTSPVAPGPGPDVRCDTVADLDFLEYPVASSSFAGIPVRLGGTALGLFKSRQLERFVTTSNAAGRQTCIYFHPYELDMEPASWRHERPTLYARITLGLRNATKGGRLRLLDGMLRRFSWSTIASDYMRRHAART